MKAAEAEDFGYLRWQQVTDATHYVNSTAISSDGNCVVAGTFFRVYTQLMADAPPPPPSNIGKYATYCFDGQGDLLWSDPFEGYEGVYTVAVSGDGKFAASGGWFSSDPYKGFVRAYDVEAGPPYLFHYPLAERVNSIAMSADGQTIVAGADNVYLFQGVNGEFPSEPFVLTLESPPAGQTIANSAQAVSVTSDGSVILVGDYYGNVYYVANENGFGTPFVWKTTSLSRLHTVAMTPDGLWFVAAGSDSTVYLFSSESMATNPPSTAETFKLDNEGRIGWSAITDDGKFITVVSNTKAGGVVVGISNDAGTMTQAWETPTPHMPNCTSMDSAGKYVAVADGFPDGQPGTFSLFDGSTGLLMWSYPTTNMNWPMFISSDGSGIAAGSDAGIVYYFTPTEPGY